MTGSYDGTARLWDATTGKPTAHLWDVPTALDESIERIDWTTQVTCGMNLDHNSSLHIRDTREWRERRGPTKSVEE